MSAKVGNITVNVSGAINGVRGDEDKKSSAANRKTLFAGDLGIGPGVPKNGHGKDNPMIEQKRAQAAKQARKLINDAWERDSKAAEGIEEMDKLKSESVDKLVEARNELKDIREQKEALADVEDEEERTAKLIELSRREVYAKAEVQNGEDAAMAYTSAITDSKIDRLKQHDMVDADKDADMIMEASNKEIMGMLVNDAKDKIDEDIKKVKEEAEKRAEAKEELEERIEKTREKREEQEELIEKAAEAAKAETEHAGAQSAMPGTESAQKDIQDILREHGLTNEDILGIDFDRKL